MEGIEEEASLVIEDLLFVHIVEALITLLISVIRGLVIQ